jgi:phage terminase large subunit-like protein
MSILLEGSNGRFSPESGDTTNRAIPLSSKGSIGLIRLVKGDWKESFISEFALFPRGDLRDQVDATSRSYGRQLLAPRPKMFVPPMLVTLKDAKKQQSDPRAA